MSGISIIICTYNGKDRLLPVLQAVYQQDFEKSRMEVLVVDNCSTDGTDIWLTRISGEFPGITLRIVKEVKPGLNNARLKGVRESRYDILLFCDDDNLLSDNYLSVGWELIERYPEIGALGGCGVPVLGSEKPAWFDERSHSYAVGPQANRNGRIDSDIAEIYGAGAFFRKKYLLPFFDAGLRWATSDRTGASLVSGGDVEMCYIVQLLRGEIWFDNRLTFRHALPATRLTWDYYVALKKGISMSAGALFSYVYILNKRKQASIFYIIAWAKTVGFGIFILIALLLKYEVVKLYGGRGKERKKMSLTLAAQINWYRLVSLIKGFKSSFIHARRIDGFLANT